jgi:hypothetical protein
VLSFLWASDLQDTSDMASILTLPDGPAAAGAGQDRGTAAAADGATRPLVRLIQGTGLVAVLGTLLWLASGILP